LGIGPMLLQALSQEGHQATLAQDGDPVAWGCDLLLLTGSLRPFVEYPRLLSGRRDGKPVTALWLLEPLPPVSLAEPAERMGMKLANLDLHRLPLLHRRLVSLLPLQRNVRRMAGRVHAARFKKALSRLGVGDCEQATSYDLTRVMCEHRWFREFYSKRWCDFVFASTLPRCQFLHSRGIAATFVPMGYDQAWGRNLGLERDIDVLFLGRTDQTPRSGLLPTICKELAARGIELRLVTRGCYGDERTQLLNRARIVLDLPRLAWEMPLMRLLMCMGCGALVVSNWTGDPAPFAREHLVQAKAGQLAEALVHHLEDAERRRRIVTSAFQFVTEELTLKRSLSTILNAIHQRAPADDSLRRIEAPDQAELTG
jgi:hypothetical protein